MGKTIEELNNEIELLKKEKIEIENQLIDIQEKNLKNEEQLNKINNIDPINDNIEWKNWVNKMKGKNK